MSDTTITNLPNTASESEMTSGSYIPMDVGSTETKKLPAQLIAKHSEGNAAIHDQPLKYTGFLALDDGIDFGKFPISNLITSLAPVFDPTRDSDHPYAVGDLVMYDGHLFRCITVHYGPMVDAHFASIDLNGFARSAYGLDNTALAPQFDSSRYYVVGDLCTKDHKLYELTYNHNGPWDPSHVREVSVEWMMSKVKAKWFKTLLTQDSFRQGAFDINGTLGQFMPWDTVNYGQWKANVNIINLTSVDYLVVRIDFDADVLMYVQSYTVSTDANYGDTFTKSTRYDYTIKRGEEKLINVTAVQYARISLCAADCPYGTPVHIGAIYDGYTKTALDNVDALVYETTPNSDGISGRCVVDQSGDGDYTDIGTAYNDNRTGSNPAKILIEVNAGTYGGLSVGGLWAKGESMFHTILSSTANYPHSTINAGFGVIENFTFYMDSAEPGDPSYALHIDSANCKDKTVIYRNCRFISTRHSAVGIGLASGQKVIFEDCEFYSRDAAAVFFHDARTSLGAGNYGGLQYITFIRCKMVSNTNWSLKMLSVESSNELIATFIDCTLTSNQAGCEGTVYTSGVTTKGALCGDSIFLGSDSHGNNIDILNAK